MPLASLSLSVLPYFILQRDLRLALWFRNDEDPDQRGRELSHQSMTYHIWGTTVDMWSRLAIILCFLHSHDIVFCSSNMQVNWN